MEFLSRKGRDPLKTSSNRAFGLVFAAVFLIVAAWPLFFGGNWRLWALATALAFGLAALLLPSVLQPFNRLWTRIGLFLHGFINPFVLGLIFVLTVVPTGLVLRLLGKDPLRLKRNPDVSSYWITRDPPGPDPQTMKRQF